MKFFLQFITWCLTDSYRFFLFGIVQSLSRFEYVEPNGKDAGINVRKKVETIMNLVNDTDKIKAVREKANANRDK